MVFVPESKMPVGILRQAAEIGRRLLADGKDDPLAPERFAQYFKEPTGFKAIGLMHWAYLRTWRPIQEFRFSFRTAAAKFHVIDESLYAPAIVRYGESGDLLRTLTEHGPEKWLMRKLQRHVVNVPKYMLAKLKGTGAKSRNPSRDSTFSHPWETMTMLLVSSATASSSARMT